MFRCKTLKFKVPSSLVDVQEFLPVVFLALRVPFFLLPSIVATSVSFFFSERVFRAQSLSLSRARASLERHEVLLQSVRGLQLQRHTVRRTNHKTSETKLELSSPLLK